MKPKVTIILNKKVSEVSDSCPTATIDIEENSKNRNWTIDNFGYGPLNPDDPDPGFWEKKAELWNSDIETVKTARCGNCLHLIRQIKLWNAWLKVLTKQKLRILMMF